MLVSWLECLLVLAGEGISSCPVLRTHAFGTVGLRDPTNYPISARVRCTEPNCKYTSGWFQVRKAQKHQEETGHQLVFTYIHDNIEAGRMATARAWCTDSNCDRRVGWYNVEKAWEHQLDTGHLIEEVSELALPSDQR